MIISLVWYYSRFMFSEATPILQYFNPRQSYTARHAPNVRFATPVRDVISLEKHAPRPTPNLYSLAISRSQDLVCQIGPEPKHSKTASACGHLISHLIISHFQEFTTSRRHTETRSKTSRHNKSLSYIFKANSAGHCHEERPIHVQIAYKCSIVFGSTLLTCVYNRPLFSEPIKSLTDFRSTHMSGVKI